MPTAKKNTQPEIKRIDQDPTLGRGHRSSFDRLSQPANESEWVPGFMKSAGLFFWEVAKILIIAYAIIKPIHAFVIQPFYVKGASMEPTFRNNEYLIIDELSYRFHEPRRGDVVVLHNPFQHDEYLIKRIIGLPGERIVISQGQVTIYSTAHPQGVLLNQSKFLAASVFTSGELDTTLSSQQYFVLGDNRPASLDSRSFGPVNRKHIVGRTMLRAWPVTRISTFSSPSIPLTNSSTQP